MRNLETRSTNWLIDHGWKPNELSIRFLKSVMTKINSKALGGLISQQSRRQEPFFPHQERSHERPCELLHYFIINSSVCWQPKEWYTKNIVFRGKIGCLDHRGKDFLFLERHCALFSSNRHHYLFLCLLNLIASSRNINIKRKWKRFLAG